MKRILTLFFFSFYFFSCADTLPKGVMSAEKMQAVYWDLMVADELATLRTPSDSSWVTPVSHQKLYEEVYKKHKITKEQFTQSQAYYRANPALLKPILDSMYNKADRIQLTPDTTNTPKRISPIDSARKAKISNPS